MVFESEFHRLRHAASRYRAAIAAALAMMACDAPAPSVVTPQVQLSPIELPAGEGSAEPFLSTSDDMVLLSWLEPEGSGHALRHVRITAAGAGVAETIVSRDDHFVNWADVPSVIQGPDGRRHAHFLQRGGTGTYDYSVRVTTRSDAGWSEPIVAHDDHTSTEHGFVTLVTGDDGSLGALWLDGRQYVDGAHGAASDEMTLRWRQWSPTGEAGPEALLDARVCDCCQTGLVQTLDGWAAVYRDRSADEVRDISSARWDAAQGRWIVGGPIHDDGWVIEGCPVNGPAIDARGDTVAVAWFTAAHDEPSVRLAFSHDGARSFEAPHEVDLGLPLGRVDVVSGPQGAALVTWLERSDDGETWIMLRRMMASGQHEPAQRVVRTTGERVAGFPKLVAAPWGGHLLAWTAVEGDETQVRALHLTQP